MGRGGWEEVAWKGGFWGFGGGAPTLLRWGLSLTSHSLVRLTMAVIQGSIADAVVTAVVVMFALYGLYLHYKTQQLAKEVPLKVLRVLANPDPNVVALRDAAALELARAMVPAVAAAVREQLATLTVDIDPAAVRESLQKSLGSMFRWDQKDASEVDADISQLLGGTVVEGLQALVEGLDPESKMGQAGQRLLAKCLKSPAVTMRVAGWFQRVASQQGSQALTGTRQY